MEINKLPVHKIVEYLKTIKIEEDYFELLDSNIDKILMKYGITSYLTNLEKAEIFRELLNFIEESEFNEIERISEKNEELLIY